MEWIKVKDGVVLNPKLKEAIEFIDPYFALTEGVYVTSGVRTEADQLRIIHEKVVKHGIDKLYPEYQLAHGSVASLKVRIDKGPELYYWQRAWSKLLNINEIVNPPLQAEVLFDYYRPGSTVNSKGRVVGLSNHQKGHSFDLSGPDLKDIAMRVDKAGGASLSPIKGYLVESQNNCCHCDIKEN